MTAPFNLEPGRRRVVLTFFWLLFIATPSVSADLIDGAFLPRVEDAGEVFSIAEAENGDLILGGDFHWVNGVDRRNLARLRASGSLDMAFAADAAPDHTIRVVTIQPGGKILVGGDFQNWNVTRADRLVRLNEDGSLDTEFTGRSSFNNSVQTLATDTEGRALVGGSFTTVNGVTRRSLVRLNPTGEVDTSFSIGEGPNTAVRSIVIQPDGKIVAAGVFTSFNGAPVQRIVRILPTGELDPAFSVSAVLVGGGIDSVVVAPNGSLLIAGGFISVSGQPRPGVAMLNANGTLNVGFAPPNFRAGSSTASPMTAVLDGAGKIWVSGDFVVANNQPLAGTRGIARFLPNGAVDSTFAPGGGLTDQMGDTRMRALKLLRNGGAVFAGRFDHFAGLQRASVAILRSNGSLERDVIINSTAAPVIDSIEPLPDGRFYLGGAFTRINGVSRHNIARLNGDGSIDPTFNPPSVGARCIVQVQADGKVVFGTIFSPRPGGLIGRLHADGSADLSFRTGGPMGSIYALRIQPDQKVLVGGLFTSFASDATQNYICRLNTDGSIDPSFDDGSGPCCWVDRIYLQPNGRIVLRGGFTSIDGFLTPHNARLLPNGEVDRTFTASASVLGIDPQGRILASNNDGLRRLLNDGGRDPDFVTAEESVGATVTALANETDGRILAAIRRDGVIRIFRFAPDGAFDAMFIEPTLRATDRFAVEVTALANAPGDALLVGGRFASVNSPHTGLLRVFARPILRIQLSYPLIRLNWTDGTEAYRLESAEDVHATAWHAFDGVITTAAGRHSASAPIPEADSKRFFRLKR